MKVHFFLGVVFLLSFQNDVMINQRCKWKDEFISAMVISFAITSRLTLNSTSENTNIYFLTKTGGDFTLKRFVFFWSVPDKKISLLSDVRLKNPQQFQINSWINPLYIQLIPWMHVKRFLVSFALNAVLLHANLIGFLGVVLNFHRITVKWMSSPLINSVYCNSSRCAVADAFLW